MLRKKEVHFLFSAGAETPSGETMTILSAAEEQNCAETVQRAGITCVQMWPLKWHLQDIFFRECFDKKEERELSETVRFFLFFAIDTLCVSTDNHHSASFTGRRSQVVVVVFPCAREGSTDVLYRCIHLAVLTRLCVTSLPLITILRVVPASVRVRV